MLVEYLEEHPSMLGRPGMGLQLSTFYRKVCGYWLCVNFPV
jgi:hypothetical protein